MAIKPDGGEELDPLQRWLHAAGTGDIPAMREMLDAGWDVDASSGGWRALMSAASDGRADCVKFLIEAGADVDAKIDLLGNSAMLAAHAGHAECLSLLMAAGCDLDVVTTRDARIEDVGTAECVELVRAERARRAAIEEASEIGKVAGKAAPGKGPKAL